MATAVAFVLKGYPRLSETFIAQEILGLERRGLEIHIVSLRRPTDADTHPVHAEIGAPVLYLPEYLYREPRRLFRAWRAQRRRPAYRAIRAKWWRDLKRDPTANRIRRFGQALVLAHELAPEVGRLHAHFLHTPASVTRYAAGLSGLPWTCSAHAVDIYTGPDWDKAEKLAECDWLVTCTAVNRDHLRNLAADADTVRLAYHGIDCRRFDAPAASRGDAPQAPVTILSVGRCVEKKGYDVLLKALARLDDGLNWRFVHIGGGPLSAKFQRDAKSLGFAERIDWLGAQAQSTVLEQYRAADLFVLASRVAADGDRDGLPNVLMEAQSQGLACLSTRVSAIPELIDDGVTGLLVEPDDPEALATALARLIADPGLRASLGQAGRTNVKRNFNAEAGLDLIAGYFGLGTAL